MANMDSKVHSSRVLRTGTRAEAACHHGRDGLAEVIMIRPLRPERAGLIGSLFTLVPVFASRRPQAASVRSTPHPLSSPAPLTLVTPGTPDDAA